jgi:hypothetical protein
MKQLGHRKDGLVKSETNGASLAAAIAFSSDLSQLAGGSVMFPKGIFRYKSHNEANFHKERCLAQGMAALAAERSNG